MVTLVCEHCSKTYSVINSRKNTSKYCCRKCADQSKVGENNVECKVCKKPFHLKPYKVTGNNCCSMECKNKLDSIRFRGENNPQYGIKGPDNASFSGMITRKKNHNNVYEFIYVGEAHPYSDTSGRIRLHRYIIEQNYKLFPHIDFNYISGVPYLPPKYDVHHKDGNSLNNDLCNLEPLTRSEHSSIHNRDKIILRDNLGRIVAVKNKTK